MTFGIQHQLAITVCKDPDDAVAGGNNYRRPEYLPIEIVRAVVVQKGTELNLPSVDLVLVDEKGQKYVMMITGRLIQTLAGVLE